MLICALLVFFSLNCAILSDSPDNSPYKLIQELGKDQDEPIKNENDQNASNLDDDLSHSRKLSVIKEESSDGSGSSISQNSITENVEKPKTAISMFGKLLPKSPAKPPRAKSKSPVSMLQQLQVNSVSRNVAKTSPFEEKLNEYAGDGNKSAKTLHNCEETNSRRAFGIKPKSEASITATEHDIQDETPLKTFQMPTARRLPPSSHRILSSSNRPKFSRSALESEFRSQKILFTTPTAVSRPTFALMSNIGLDDSLNCYKSPSTTILHDTFDRRLSPPSVKQHAIQNHKTDTRPIPADDVQTEEAMDDNANTCEKDDRKVLKINGKDFVVNKKIGQGGSSSVFLAEHKQSRLECAIKVISI